MKIKLTIFKIVSIATIILFFTGSRINTGGNLFADNKTDQHASDISIFNNFKNIFAINSFFKNKTQFKTPHFYKSNFFRSNSAFTFINYKTGFKKTQTLLSTVDNLISNVLGKSEMNFMKAVSVVNLKKNKMGKCLIGFSDKNFVNTVSDNKLIPVKLLSVKFINDNCLSLGSGFILKHPPFLS